MDALTKDTAHEFPAKMSRDGERANVCEAPLLYGREDVLPLKLFTVDLHCVSMD